MSVKIKRRDLMRKFIGGRLSNVLITNSDKLYNIQHQEFLFLKESKYKMVIEEIECAVEDYLKECFWDKKQINEE